MCGRFALPVPKKKIAQVFQAAIAEDLDLPPRVNIAPGSQVLGIVETSQGRVGRLFKWGLIPFWAKDEKIGYRTINARAETLAEKPAFREAFKRRRCIIPAQGFYEWEKTPEGKIPHLFSAAGGGLLAMAGLWENWRSPAGEDLQSCTIITTQANGLVGRIHDRMPVVLSPNAWAEWFDPRQLVGAVQGLLKPLDEDLLQEQAVDPKIKGLS